MITLVTLLKKTQNHVRRSLVVIDSKDSKEASSVPTQKFKTKITLEDILFGVEA